LESNHNTVRELTHTVTVDTDINNVRYEQVQHLIHLAELAYEQCTRKRVTDRQGWHQQYNNHVAILNILLKDMQLKDYEERMQYLEEREKQRGNK
jgi:hypothetical protein